VSARAGGPPAEGQTAGYTGVVSSQTIVGYTGAEGYTGVIVVPSTSGYTGSVPVSAGPPSSSPTAGSVTELMGQGPGPSTGSPPPVSGSGFAAMGSEPSATGSMSPAGGKASASRTGTGSGTR
jgi:hypothetical protein